jgi:hypothetical protein
MLARVCPIELLNKLRVVSQHRVVFGDVIALSQPLARVPELQETVQAQAKLDAGQRAGYSRL